MNGLIKHTRLIAGALAALGALALPASALAGHKAHLLKLYKVEQHVDLEGEDGIYTVSCPNGDYALDGMWRIDDVEQDNDFGGTLLDLFHTVRPVQAKSVATDTYQFKFTPLSGGDVQIKLWVTCVDQNTSGHQWTITPAVAAPNTTSTVDTTGVGPYAFDDAATKATATCPAGQIVVAPGFDVTSGSGGNGDLVVSKPDASDSTWTWKWAAMDSGASGIKVTHSWRCLTLKSQAYQSHTHRIVKQVRSQTDTIPANVTSETRLSCGELYKGLIGGWDLSGTANGHGGTAHVFDYVWYLGMDPRIKTRAFKWANNDSIAQPVDTYLVCFKDKTT